MTIDAVCSESRVNISLPGREGITLSPVMTNTANHIEVLGEISWALDTLLQLENLHSAISNNLSSVLAMPASRRLRRPAMGEVWLGGMRTISARENIAADQLALDSIINEIVNSIGINNVPSELQSILTRLQSVYGPLRAQMRTASFPRAQTIINNGNNLAYLSPVEILKRTLGTIARGNFLSATNLTLIGLDQVPWAIISSSGDHSAYRRAIEAIIARTILVTQNTCRNYAAAIERAGMTATVITPPITPPVIPPRPIPSSWRVRVAGGLLGGITSQGPNGQLEAAAEIISGRFNLQISYFTQGVYNAKTEGLIRVPNVHDALAARLYLGDVHALLGADFLFNRLSQTSRIDNYFGARFGYRLLNLLTPSLGLVYSPTRGSAFLVNADAVGHVGRLNLVAQVGGNIFLDGTQRVYVQVGGLFNLGQFNIGLNAGAAYNQSRISGGAGLRACVGNRDLCASLPLNSLLGGQ
ncbi:hypothetical protein HZB07_03895 [Candidatus Saganbacteria bacterium]|nr:hypothetical protein [Candidatus Saganbacteria bacterium]